MQRDRELILILILLPGILAPFAPAMAGMEVFAAGPDQISSTGVLDIAQDFQGNLYFATDNGLSYYDGAWHITHRTYGNPDKGILSDHILALEVDDGGGLWLGYPDGLQRIEGGSFVTLQDQQMLKSLDIHDLLRRGSEMWIAAGNAGIHRYAGGNWTWFRPGGREGLGCGYVTALGADPAAGTLYVACREGIWFTGGTGDRVLFTSLAGAGPVTGDVRGIHGNPFGGVYLFNASAVVSLERPGRSELAVTTDDLLPGIEINDLAVGSDRTLWIATNYGIYAWKDGRVQEHLDAPAGLRHNAVKKISLDSSGRLWFVTPENVGFIELEENPEGREPVVPMTTFEIPKTTRGTSTTPIPAQVTPGISLRVSTENTPAPSSPLAGLLDTLRRFLAGFFPG